MDATQIGTLIVALTGLVTAFTAIMKNRHEAKHKKREQDVAVTSAFDERHQVLYKAIQDNLVDPLIKRINDLTTEIQALREEAVVNQKELALIESKYQVAIIYIQELLTHIKSMAYPGDPPTPPSGLDV